MQVPERWRRGVCRGPECFDTAAHSSTSRGARQHTAVVCGRHSVRVGGDAVMEFANTADKGAGKLFVRTICPTCASGSDCSGVTGPFSHLNATSCHHAYFFPSRCREQIRADQAVVCGDAIAVPPLMTH